MGEIKIKKQKPGNIFERVRIPNETQLELDGHMVRLSGKFGQAQRGFKNPLVRVSKVGNEIVLEGVGSNKNTKKILNSFKAHILNLIKGVNSGFAYKLKICSGHFPMSVKVENGSVIITNFLGERIPRIARIIQGTNVAVKGDLITVSGANIEEIAQTASNMEIATKIKNRDRRVFQDGIYIFSKE